MKTEGMIMYKHEKTALEKKQETQRVFDYCLYMMLTSYFDSSRCRSRQLEKKLFLGYKEYNVNKVYTMEEQTIRLVEAQVLPLLPKMALDRSVEVFMVPEKEPQVTKLLLRTAAGSYEVEGIYEGKNTKLQVAVW